MTLAAMRPLEISVAGTLKKPRGSCGLSFSILRVDGRLVWLHKSVEAGVRLPNEGPFEVPSLWIHSSWVRISIVSMSIWLTKTENWTV